MTWSSAPCVLNLCIRVSEQSAFTFSTVHLTKHRCTLDISFALYDKSWSMD